MPINLHGQRNRILPVQNNMFEYNNRFQNQKRREICQKTKRIKFVKEKTVVESGKKEGKNTIKESKNDTDIYRSRDLYLEIDREREIEIEKRDILNDEN